MVAAESAKTKKAREKIQKKWEERDQLITKEALAKTAGKIRDWIAIHHAERVSLKGKEMCLFNQNRDAAILSKRVQQIAEKLKNGVSVD